jgi:hypothetical protein
MLDFFKKILKKIEGKYLILYRKSLRKLNLAEITATPFPLSMLGGSLFRGVSLLGGGFYNIKGVCFGMVG